MILCPQNNNLDMEVRIGDIVRFISEKLEGKVSGILDNNTVSVYCDDYGFDIPAAVNDLVVIKPAFATRTHPGSPAASVSDKPMETEISRMVYLAFVPDNSSNLAESRYEVYLVNDTHLTALYSISHFDGEHYSGIAAGNCSSGSPVSIGNYTLKELDAVKQFAIQLIFFQKGRFSFRPAIDTVVKINPVSLCKGGSYKHARWFKTVSLLRPLEGPPPVEAEEIEIPSKVLEQAKREKERESTPKTEKPVSGNIVEVDLHAGELLETTAGMESKDILDYQLETFRRTLEEYKLKRGQKIVFIHGKGDGVLKQRIRWELQTKYKRFNHQDASFKQYGYGATMVTIK